MCRALHAHQNHEHGETGRNMPFLSIQQYYSIISQVYEMGERGSSKRFLMVKPGDTNWSVTTSLKEEVSLMESEGCREMCPAHPANSYNHQTGSVSWTTKARKGKYEVLLRCSSHDGVHASGFSRKGKKAKGEEKKSPTSSGKQTMHQHPLPPI